jgi:DNA-binding response OmpR family regulator
MTTNILHLPTTARVVALIDQPLLARLIQLALVHGPYATEVTPTVAGAIAALAARRPHLALIDMDLAQDPLWDALGLRSADAPALPVIALTRRGDLATKLAAFEHGADDILTVPFSPEELVARIVALMRRAYRGAAPFTPVLRLGELELDLLNRSVRVQGHDLHLTALDQGLLYLLAANAGRVVTRDEILDHLWGVDFMAESNVVDRHVRSLRAKLQNGWRQPRYIATVPGQGYRFVPTTPGATSD